MKTTEHIALEIVRLVNRLNDRDIKPTIHGTDLLIFGDERKDLINFILRYSVVKNVDDLRRILLWRLNALPDTGGTAKGGIPLSGLSRASGLPKNREELLYNAVFDPKEFLRAQYQPGRPLNIVLFRRGYYGPQLTNLLKTLPNTHIQIILGATEDGKTWFHAAREFRATGISGAGVALLDLARDRSVKEFLSTRIGNSGSLGDDELAQNFNYLVQRLLKPQQAACPLSDELAPVYQSAMRMDIEKRKPLARYLKTFSDHWVKHHRENRKTRFSFRGIPIRSLVLTGAAIDLGIYDTSRRNREEGWQKAIDTIGQLLNIEENRVILPTYERQHLVAVRDSGIVHFSEESITYHKDTKSSCLGLWLVNKVVDDLFIDEFTASMKRQNIDLTQVEAKDCVDNTTGTHEPLGARTCEQIACMTRKVPSVSASIIAQELEKLSANGPRATTQTLSALGKADAILYSDVNLETSVGCALIVPGVGEAIKSNTHAIKINLADLAAEDKEASDIPVHLERLYRYATGNMLYKTGPLPSLPDVESYVDYVLVSHSSGDSDTASLSGLADVDRTKNRKVGVVTVSSEKNIKYGFFASGVLQDAIITLIGLKSAGFRIIKQEQGPGLAEMRPGRELGLFRSVPEVRSLISEIVQNQPEIKRKGAFIFDVDMTILPKNAKLLTEYPELAYLFMRLLREGFRVAIISGSSEYEQMKRILDAINVQMRDGPKALQNLTFYVNGGATKIKLSNAGRKKYDVVYNSKHSMDCKTLKAAVTAALREMAEDWFVGRGDPRKRDRFIQANMDKFQPLRLQAPWGKDRTWEPEWRTPEDVVGMEEERSKITFPWGELRGVFAGSQKVGSISIRAMQTFEWGDRTIDIRSDFQDLIRKHLGKSAGEFNIRSGGTSTTDITRSGADKTAAAKDFIKHVAKCDSEWFFYFGDEFYERDKQLGNDEVLARDEGLKCLRTLAVNYDDMKGANEKTKWIGRSPQATLEFLEEILIRSGEWQL
jgi:2-phospho-L-lactate transferase/gluconeogenesis factor (CofD/UPF0052 family)